MSRQGFQKLVAERVFSASSYILLLRYKTQRFWELICHHFFLTGYYVLSFSSTELSDNPFMSFILSATADLPAYPVIWGLMKIFGRRSLTGVSLVLGGLSVTSASLITNDIARYVIMIVIISDLRN